jgi:hypothetical protein
MMLVDRNCTSVELLAEAADKILEAGSTANGIHEISAVTKPNSDHSQAQLTPLFDCITTLTSKIDSLESKIAKMNKQPQHDTRGMQGNNHSDSFVPSHRIPQTRFQNNVKQDTNYYIPPHVRNSPQSTQYGRKQYNYDLCYFHNRYGRAAHSCYAPCGWNAKPNAPTYARNNLN